MCLGRILLSVYMAILLPGCFECFFAENGAVLVGWVVHSRWCVDSLGL